MSRIASTSPPRILQLISTLKVHRISLLISCVPKGLELQSQQPFRQNPGSRASSSELTHSRLSWSTKLIWETEQGEKFTWNKDVILNLFALYFTFWCTTWTYSIVPTSLAFIDKAFPTQTGITYWIASSPGLCQCVLSLFIGELSDIFGRRWFLLFGNLCMLVGNIVVGRGSTVSVYS